MSTAQPIYHAPGQPLSKAAPTAQLTGPRVLPKVQSDDETTTKPQEDVRKKTIRSPKESVLNDPTSLPTTFNLIQKVLAPDKTIPSDAALETATIEDILPPLTSSNDVDVELYAILAIIVKDFVNTWYTKITPDRAFVGEIIQIVAHCSRALEQRLRKVDIPLLCLDEIPSLVENHFKTYRTAKSHSLNSPYAPSLGRLYHELEPHPALSPLPLDADPTTVRHQADNERAYRQLLVQGSLAVLLPNEDLQNAPLRMLVGDIIADLIIGQALAGKVSEGWFLHEAVSKVTAILSDRVQPKASGTQLRDDAKDRLEKFGLLTHDSKSEHSHSPATDQSRISTWFWRLMQYVHSAYLFLWYLVKEFQFSRTKPKRQDRSGLSPSSSMPPEKSHMQPSIQEDPMSRPVLTYGIYSLISTLLQMADRMPWVTGMFRFGQQSLLFGPGQAGFSNSIVDRFLYHFIETHVLPPSLLPIVLRNLRVALFPKNSMGPPAPPAPSPSEKVEIRRRTASSIFGIMPQSVARMFYATHEDEKIVDAIEQDMLCPLDDVYVNKHLVYSILELVLVRLIPELNEQPVSALLAERGVVWTEEPGSEEIDPLSSDALAEST